MLISALLTMIDAHAISRMAEAQVRLVQGVPCFGVPDEEVKGRDTLLIGALMVEDAQEAYQEIWAFQIAPRGQWLTLPAGSCFLYGHAPAGTVALEPPVLHSAHMYAVYLNARTSDPGDPTQGYIGKFCLFDQSDGSRRLVQFAPGSPEWRQGVCAAPAR